MSYALPSGAAAPETPAEEWREKALSAIDSAVGGPTAATGGYVEAAPRTGLAHGQVTGGGLASSPIVQSLSSSSGLKQSEGLTKAELLEGLSGRQQAAAQLGALPVLPGAAIGAAGSPLAVNVPAAVPPSRTEAPSTHTPLVGGHIQHSVVNPNPTSTPLTSAVPPPAPAQSVVPVKPAAPASTVSPSIQVENSLANALAAARAPATGMQAADTPAVEGMPGGWLGAKQAPGELNTSLTDDIVAGLDKVGQTAYNVLPASLKEGINPNRPSNEPSLMDRARGVYNQLPSLADLTSPTSPDRKRTSIDHTTTTASPTRTRGSISGAVTNKSPEELINQAKHMASDLLSGSRSRAEQALARAQEYVDHAVGANDVPKTTTAVKPAEHHATAVAASSLPSQEKEGAKPGDYSTGVGALPGSVNESSVAVLPEEKRLGADPFASGTATAPTVKADDLTPSSVTSASSPKAVVPVSSGAIDATPAGKPTTASDGYAPTGPSSSFTQGRPYDDKDFGATSATRTDGAYTPKGPSASFDTTDAARPSASSLLAQDAEPVEQPKTLSSSTGPTGAGQLVDGPLSSTGTSSAVPPANSTSISGFAPTSSSTSGIGHHLLSNDLNLGSNSKALDLGLAPPLGAIVESTPIVGERGDKHHNILPGELKPAVTTAPVKTIPVAELPTETPALTGDKTASGLTTDRDVSASTGDKTAAGHSVHVIDSSKDHADTKKSSATPSFLSSSTAGSSDAGKLDQSSAGRLDSSASVTAIKHGHIGTTHAEKEGSGHSTLESVSEKPLPSAPTNTKTGTGATDDVVKRAVAGQDVTGSTGVAPVESHISHAIGGSKHETSAVSDAPASPISSRTGGAHNRKSSIEQESSHHRTGSTSSDKKKGFLSKIKDKLHHEKH